MWLQTFVFKYLFAEPETNYEEEMQILRVIEAYCSLSASSTNKQRHTFSTTSSKSPFFSIGIENILDSILSDTKRLASKLMWFIELHN